MIILVIAPNHQIFALYVQQQIKQDPGLTKRDFVHAREEHQLLGHPQNIRVIMIGNARAEDINVRLEARRRFTNVKTIADII